MRNYHAFCTLDTSCEKDTGITVFLKYVNLHRRLGIGKTKLCQNWWRSWGGGGEQPWALHSRGPTDFFLSFL